MTSSVLKKSSVSNRQGNYFNIWRAWTWQEIKMLFREPVAIIFSLLFPLIIYVFIVLPNADLDMMPGVRFVDTMYPGLILSTIANLLVLGMPIYMSELRSKGVDRRYAIIPLPPGILALAILCATFVLVFASTSVISCIVGFNDGLLSTALSPVFIALIVGTIIWLSSIGFLLGTLPLSPRAVQAISAATFFIMFFGSGAAMPLDKLPESLQRVLDWNPLKQWLDVLTKIYTSQEPTYDEWMRLWMGLVIIIVCNIIGLKLWKRRY